MDTVLLALGAPRRRDILRLVRRRERSAGEIHRALGGVTFGAVSQHLGVLERAGLVTARRDGRSRLYQARPEGLEPLKQWLDGMWDDALASLARLAETEEALAGRGPRKPARAGGQGRRRRPRHEGREKR
jgi:DNA-binding transcriptional ArsR family regulator